MFFDWFLQYWARPALIYNAMVTRRSLDHALYNEIDKVAFDAKRFAARFAGLQIFRPTRKDLPPRKHRGDDGATLM